MSNLASPGIARLAVPGPYILRDLFLEAELSDESAFITCVEFWEDNLYVGTSTAEIIHYVSIPSEDGSDPTFIQASRRSTREEDDTKSYENAPGVQRILLVPASNRACILSDGILTFYTLPELSPAYNGFKVPGVTTVGGLDQNAVLPGTDQSNADVIMVGLRSKTRLIRVGQKSRPDPLGQIDIGGCLIASRRDAITCIADGRSYSLVDVVEQQSIPLFEISSQNTSNPPSELKSQDGQSDQTSQSVVEPQATSTEATSSIQDTQPSDVTATTNNEQSAPPRQSSLASSGYKPGHTRDFSTTSVRSTFSATSRLPLRPNIVSPTSTLFLLTTGTSPEDPGIGIFVNMDGDVERSPLEFSQYPLCLVVDGGGVDDLESATSSSQPDEGYVLAVVAGQSVQSSFVSRIEVLRWDTYPGDPGHQKYYIDVPGQAQSYNSVAGMGHALTSKEVMLTQVADCLRLMHSNLKADESIGEPRPGPNVDGERASSEAAFINRLSVVQARLLVWNANCIWWVIKTPLVVQLETRLSRATDDSGDASLAFIDRLGVETTLNELRGREPQTELDFISIGYIRQKASLLLFLDIIDQALDDIPISDRDLRITEEALKEGEADPRVILAVVPELRDEICQNEDSTWLPRGVIATIQAFFQRRQLPAMVDPSSVLARTIFPTIGKYLHFWRQRKGFGSITDEREVFETVDAAILRLLLIVDSSSPPGPATKGSVRAELGAFVDRGVDCFERAITLLEKYNRLYALSRLYESRKMSGMVLGTWKRIIEGERDAAGEFTDGEDKLVKYLRRIDDTSLVEEYGIWLANRNPALGVRIFVENKHVRYSPRDAIQILDERAPAAVKYLLEYLVFSENMSQYANDLIGYYVDTVTSELDRSTSARQILRNSYEAYRALTPPKPTYSQFVTDNAIDADWWRARLRLLQLLGGSHGAASQYDVPAIIAKLEKYQNQMVPEMIILGGRQGRHKEALHLLVHGLGDYDTATTYCFQGGSSTYSSTTDPESSAALPSRQQQATLFSHLLYEFMRLEDNDTRLRQSTELLDRFSGWFDVVEVLQIIPDTWPVEAVSSFLERALRQIVSERHETTVTVALTSCQNLDLASTLIEKIRTAGPRIE